MTSPQQVVIIAQPVGQQNVGGMHGYSSGTSYQMQQQPGPVQHYGQQGSMFGGGGAGNFDIEGQKPGIGTYDVQIRHGFVRKVFILLTIQLLVTFGVVILFTFSDSVKGFVRDPANSSLYYVSLFLPLAIIIGLSCFSGVARSHPWGLIFLGILTLAESYVLGFIASFYDTQFVLMAIGITLAITFSLCLFACQTKYDITSKGPYLLVALVAFFFFSLVLIFVKESRTTQLIFVVLGVLLFSAFLVYDTQLILGGGTQFQYEVDDYVFAALNLYLDVINIFILILIGGGGGDN